MHVNFKGQLFSSEYFCRVTDFRGDLVPVVGCTLLFCYFVYVLPAVLSFFVCVFVFLRNSRDCVSDILKEHPKASCTHRHTR